MSSILVKIDFSNKNYLTKKVIDKINKDLLSLVKSKNFFNEKEKVFVNYKLKKTTL